MLLFAVPLSISAANKKKEEVKIVPFYQGIQIGVDLLSPTQALFSNNYGAGIKADINLKNKYFPTFEVGFSNFDKVSINNNEKGTRCAFSGEYLKVGLNFPLSLSGDKAENMFFAGIHYGFSAFSYNIENLYYPNNYWDNTITSFQNEKASAGWVEIVTGVRVKVMGPISLGWMLHYKSTIHVSNGDHSIPPFIPGYGLNIKPMSGMTLNLYYKLPF